MNSKTTDHFEVLIIGGSFAGLSAGLSLGRALRKVLIVDSGHPCNIKTPNSHNFITHDGEKPSVLAQKAKKDVLQYPTVTFWEDRVVDAEQKGEGFEFRTQKGKFFSAKKIIFATGVTDLMPDIQGFEECWGISVLHCPYCHGYEVKNQKTGLLGNGDMGFEFSKIITHWTNDLILFTNGKSTLSTEQTQLLTEAGVQIEEETITELEHEDGFLQNVILKNKSKIPVKAIYAKPEIRQQTDLPVQLGCKLNDHGLIEVDIFQQSDVSDIYAAGDNSSVGRSVAVATAAGSVAGMMLNKDMIESRF